MPDPERKRGTPAVEGWIPTERDTLIRSAAEFIVQSGFRPNFTRVAKQVGLSLTTISRHTQARAETAELLWELYRIQPGRGPLEERETPASDSHPSFPKEPDLLQALEERLSSLASFSQYPRMIAVEALLNQRQSRAANTEPDRMARFDEVLTSVSGDVRQDLGLALRVRGNLNEWPLIKKLEDRGLNIHEFLFPQNGVTFIPGSRLEDPVFMISADTWDEALGYLKSTDYGQVAMVMLPELITIAGLPLSQVAGYNHQVNAALQQTMMISKDNPSVTFLLPTIEYAKRTSEGSEIPLHQHPKPRNTVYSIENGTIKRTIYKRLGATVEEQEFLESVPEESPNFVNEGSVLICSDFARGRYEFRSDDRRRLHEVGGDALARAQFVSLYAKTIYVVACWGVPPDPNFYGSSGNSFYLWMLRVSANDYFRPSQNVTYQPIEKIVVCDRAADPARINQGFYSTKPLTGVFFNPR